jgi:Tol biopolymer transport system component
MSVPSHTPTWTPTITPSATTSSTPTSVPSPTPNPILNPSVLKDITVFYTFFSREQGAKQGEDEDRTVAELWRIQADGSEKQRLFVRELKGKWEVWLGDLGVSPDARELVFVEHVSNRDFGSATSSLWVMGIDGADLREIAGSSEKKPGDPDWTDEDGGVFFLKERPVSPIWSPTDNSLVAFADFVNVPVQEPGMVYLVNARTGQRWKLGEGEIFDWSPDGNAMVVYSGANWALSNDLRILYPDGTQGPSFDWSSQPSLHSLDWSPFTETVVAQTIVGTVIVIDLNNGSEETVVYKGHNNRGYKPQWSSDGRMISFARTAEDVENLYVLDVDSGDVRMVMQQVGSAGVWSPDSQLILVQSGTAGPGLYLVSVSDGQHWRIPNTESSSKGAWWPSQAWLFSEQQ